MSTRGAPDSWLGTSGEWGLTRHKHAELCDELSDHLSEMARTESHGAAENAKETLSQPKVRRKLAGVHLADQVYATLNRLPDKQEWRELMWLGVWYLGVLLSDWVSLLAEQEVFAENLMYSNLLNIYEVSQGPFLPLVTAAWVLQGLARAGFISSFTYTLWRSWQLGPGVCLARILQLKLIHTVLVITALLLIGDRLWNSWFDPNIVKYSDSVWFSAPAVLVLLVVSALAVWFFSKGKHWVLALGLLLMGLFLYPAGPSVVSTYACSMPLAWEIITQPDGSEIWQPSVDQANIEKKAAQFGKWNEESQIDIENNRFYYSESRAEPLLGTIWSHTEFAYYFGNSGWSDRQTSPGFLTEKPSGKLLAAPVSAPGAALNWLAAPIPILGVIGLVGMVFLMGRCGFTSALSYSALCIFAIASTILPFAYASDGYGIVDFTQLGVVAGPCPGFEGLLIGLRIEEDGLFVLGLLLSAAIPWLLTSLFLKPGRTEQQPDDGDKMQEAG